LRTWRSPCRRVRAWTPGAAAQKTPRGPGWFTHRTRGVSLPRGHGQADSTNSWPGQDSCCGGRIAGRVLPEVSHGVGGAVSGRYQRVASNEDMELGVGQPRWLVRLAVVAEHKPVVPGQDAAYSQRRQRGLQFTKQQHSSAGFRLAEHWLARSRCGRILFGVVHDATVRPAAKSVEAMCLRLLRKVFQDRQGASPRITRPLGAETSGLIPLCRDESAQVVAIRSARARVISTRASAP
jgi:hypothetical protein